jgi:hypothetical protein
MTRTSPAEGTSGAYAPTGTNGRSFFVDPPEFWSGTWKEGANGWRVQLRVYYNTNFFLRNGVGFPVSTNLMLSVEWGSPTKDSGGGYFLAPNGKFARFELMDANGNVVPPNPTAGRGALGKWGNINKYPGGGLSYETVDPPDWLSLESGSLVASFPTTISTNVYPHFPDTGQMAGEIGASTNRPPFLLAFLKLDQIYSITNKGEYTLVVQPVLYRKQGVTNDEVLERVDMPCVTIKLNLESDGSVIKMR